MAGHPTIAYVLLRNAHFGPKLASSVELCVRDLALHSRYRTSTLVVCPKIDAPFEGVEVAAVPEVWAGGNVAKALAVGRMLRRRGVDIVIVENHLPAAGWIGAVSGAPTILHSHAYVTAPASPLKRLERRIELKGVAGFAFVSRDCAARFQEGFPHVQAPVRAVPNGLDMTVWAHETPKDKTILSVGRALDDKGHLQAMQAIAQVLPSRPEWTARFILSATDREPSLVARLKAMAQPFDGRVRIDSYLPYSDVQRAWETAAIGMVLTKSPEPFGRTALEALATGTALVTSGLGGLAEVAGKDAEIVAPGDEPGVAAALAALMDAPERRAERARAGRTRVERLFDIRKVAGAMDDFIDEVLAARSVGRSS